MPALSCIGYNDRLLRGTAHCIESIFLGLQLVSEACGSCQFLPATSLIKRSSANWRREYRFADHRREPRKSGKFHGSVRLGGFAQVGGLTRGFSDPSSDEGMSRRSSDVSVLRSASAGESSESRWRKLRKEDQSLGEPFHDFDCRFLFCLECCLQRKPQRALGLPHLSKV